MFSFAFAFAYFDYTSLLYDIKTSMGEIKPVLGDKIQIFPNPARSNDVIHISVSNIKIVDVKIYSISGTIMNCNTTVVNDHEISIELSGLSPGAYVAFLESESGNNLKQVFYVY
jgi:hypothetical protein